MLWWIGTPCRAAENLAFSQEMESSFIAYLFGMSDYDPLETVKLHFRKTSLFNRRRAFDLYYILMKIREEADPNDLVDDEMLYHFALALSPFCLEDGRYTLVSIRIKLPLGFKNHKGVKVEYPSVDELVSMIKGKQLQFYTDFVEDHCSVEDVINRKMQEYVLNLRHDNEFYLYDQLFRIQIFLKKMSDEPSEMQFMEPVDVCDFDVNSKILKKLTEESNGYYNDATMSN